MADASHGGIVVHNRAVQSFILCVLMVSKCKKSLRIVFFVTMISPYGAVVMHLTCNEKIRGSNPRAGSDSVAEWLKVMDC